MSAEVVVKEIEEPSSVSLLAERQKAQTRGDHEPLTDVVGTYQPKLSARSSAETSPTHAGVNASSSPAQARDHRGRAGGARGHGGLEPSSSLRMRQEQRCDRRRRAHVSPGP